MNLENLEITKIKRNWVAKELTTPKYQSKTVKLKTDYKRIQNNLVRLEYEKSTDSED